ncbi:MAG: DUF2066 domain-containing protein [Rhodanobacteraceae bacterium]
MRVFLSLGGLLLMLLSAQHPVRAVAPASYTGEAPVASQSDEERDKGLQAALANVIIEITGDTAIVARSDVTTAIAKASRYVLQYQYRRGDTDDPTTTQLTLVAQFDRSAVNAMLASLGIGMEGSEAVPIDAVPTEASIWIGGIESADDYARALGYLGKLDLVRDVEPLRARADGMLVHLSLATDLSHFLAAVNAEGTLGVINGSPPVDGVDAGPVDATLALLPP